MTTTGHVLPPQIRADLGGDALPEALYLWLCEHLPGGATIVELGSGTGTRALCARWDVVSIEHDEAWATWTRRHTAARVIDAPLVQGWYDPVAVERGLAGQAYDLLLIDGPPSPRASPTRHLMLRHLPLFDLAVPIAIDDVHRWAERRLFTRLVARTGRGGEILEAKDKQVGVIP